VRVEIEFLASSDVNLAKPKGVYDLCFCFDEYPDAMTIIAADWRSRRAEPLVVATIAILNGKWLVPNY
jgi:hypothetical protein